MENKNYFEHISGLFPNDASRYEEDTAEILIESAKVIDWYSQTVDQKHVGNKDTLLRIMRKASSLFSSLTPRLAYYESREMKSYWQKNLVRAVKRKELYKRKSEDKLTEKMIESMSDTSQDYQRAVEFHTFSSNVANYIKLVSQGLKGIIEATRAEMIHIQSEMKHSQNDK